LTRLVVDVSVAVKWFLLGDEPLKDRAVDLLARAIGGEVEFLVPDLFWVELGNVLWKAARRHRCTEAQAVESLLRARQLDLPAVPLSTQLLEQAFEIANRYGQSFYDSLYVATAVSQQATLITADEKLANATAAHLPVKWLGAIAAF
jgi:predicted nucleic acid-binding protein